MAALMADKDFMRFSLGFFPANKRRDFSRRCVLAIATGSRHNSA
jgi:hypothetical protein